jgi:hypothetical protein
MTIFVAFSGPEARLLPPGVNNSTPVQPVAASSQDLRLRPSSSCDVDDEAVAHIALHHALIGFVRSRRNVIELI